MSRFGGFLLVVTFVLAGLAVVPGPVDAAVTDVSVVWTRDLPGATVRESSPTLADLDADGSL
jgi:hypothetical protein